ncbi:MAG: hypothetical protein GF375_03795 [Candidatus Omnitrophica bacterium]|nr:hypothetical protein [Candidatus Omnitrophota bacterium]MBD3269183.1 hypothetical protein [Candidatus Omnitrophota bacterium]
MSIKEVELNIPGEFKNRPFFYDIIKKFNVVPSILEASFSTEVGWAIVKFEGEQADLDKLFDFLEKEGVEVNFR